MLKDNELDGYTADPATGFLEKAEKNSFGARDKTAFLKAFKTHGNQSKAMHDLGYSYTILEFHRRKDLIFNKAFEETLLEMRHILESAMYTAGVSGKSKDAETWLKAHFPDVYKPSAAKRTKQAAVDPLEALYKKL